MTTDGDLMIGADLLALDPEITGVLESAGFSGSHNPGSRVSPGGVAIDIMGGSIDSVALSVLCGEPPLPQEESLIPTSGPVFRDVFAFAEVLTVQVRLQLSVLLAAPGHPLAILPGSLNHRDSLSLTRYWKESVRPSRPI